MIDLSYDFIVTLQKEVSRKFGVDAIAPSDCKRLATSISEVTHKLVSETTLKRVFGFATAQHSFSNYTLSTLAQYCNYKDWEDFQTRHYLETNTADQEESANKWGELKSKAVTISHYTITTIKNRAGMPFQNTIPRGYCFAQMERFLEGDYAATAFIAPSGWGKSTTLVHLAEYFWFSKEAKYKQDICWFINAHAVGNLLMRGFALHTWLDHQLNLGNGENFREYFADHFDKAGGRMILIVDGFDEVVVSADKLKLLYTKLEEFVYSNDKYPWIKVILSIRSTSWADMFQHSLQTPIFRRYWYLGNEMDEETNTNMPPLTEQEVKSVLYNHQLTPIMVRTFSDQLLQILRLPYYLQLFCQQNTGRDYPFPNEHLSLLEMVSKLVQTKIFNTPTNSFKIRVIERLLQFTSLSNTEQIHTNKSLLLDEHGDLYVSYKELLTDNILIEEVHYQELAFRVDVRFTHPLLLEYFTAMHYIQQIGTAALCDVLQQIVKQQTAATRVGVLRWILRYAINNEQSEIIHKMLGMPQLSNTERAYLLEYLIVHYQHENTRGVSLKNVFPAGYFRKNPLHRYLNDNFLHQNKKKLLNALLELADTAEDKLKVHSLQFITSLMQLDAEQCEQELNYIKKVTMRELPEEEVWVTPYDLFLFIYEYLKFGIVNEGIKERIYNYPRYLNGTSRQPLSVSHELVFRFTGLAFALLQDNRQLSVYPARIAASYPLLQWQKTDPLRLSLLCWQAFGCIRQDQLPGATRIVRHLEVLIKRYPFEFTGNRLAEQLQRLLQANIYLKENELNKAMRTAESVLEMAQKADFKLLMIACYQLLEKLYALLHLEKPPHNVQHQADLLAKSTSFRQLIKLWEK